MMALRPEELTWIEPTRLTVQNTLGGAWADHWDRAVQTIRISGHTGWRPTGGLGGGGGGEAAFISLRDTSFQVWNDTRTAIARGGGDPNVVRLEFVDALDMRAALVAPRVFTLKRSKTSPLLQRYNIELLVLQDLALPTGVADPINAAINAATAFVGGAMALDGVAGAIDAGLNNLGGLFP
ncbi:hypothetical protein F1189_13495 [Rhodovastum atsumiense]|uniref:Phage tail protein n=1 Tax=Rhodovastum atsumiense TaxID=504468 RepID=A0A5M6ITC9_9PROT|nr:hypothetical protein [Rhodovastum atsumiense]KAA5611573.1 hypothetical protein F1189_13495 [Rhodovastum atsumiense]